MQVQQSNVQVMGIDAGGTMTDTFFVRADGRFVVGKAQSNPGDESLAIYNSSVDALAHWGREVDDVYPELVTCVYSGTAMLNRILMRKGLDVGLICNRGFEQIHSMGRALQSYLGYALEDRIHLNTHRYDEPLVPVSRTRGVTERTDVQGRIVIPLREEEVRQATRELVEAGAQAVVICLLQSHKNETSEQRARDIVREELQRLKSDIPVFASVDYYPSRKESHRMNTTILEAYGAEPSRQTLKKVSDRFKKHGAKFDLRVMATHGGTISWKAKELARTIVSGPIGGVIGSRLLGEYLGDENIACSDIGGTSFDVALITKGSFAIKSDPDMARLVLSLPLVAMDSVGAGAGSFVRLDPYSKSIKLGPDSAGYRVGTCWPESGLDTVSVSDCHVVLGYLNPDNFLGGAIKLDVQRARDHIKAQIADPLGLSVEDAAAGVIELLDLTLSEYLRANISAKGYNPAEFTCFSYGGAGPVHTYGYTEGVGFKDVVVPAWAAGFSAFGCACADFEYRYDKSVDLGCRPVRPRRPEGCSLHHPAGRLGRAGGQGDRRVRHQRLQTRRCDADPRLQDAVHGPAQRPGDRLAGEQRRHGCGLGQDRRQLRDHLRPRLCQLGPLAGAGLLDHRRHPARHGRDPETGAARRPGCRPDATSGGLPRHPPLLPPQEVGRGGPVEDGIPEGRQPHHRPRHHRIRCHHLRRARWF
jgi:acetone carboxylase beta subunit